MFWPSQAALWRRTPGKRLSYASKTPHPAFWGAGQEAVPAFCPVLRLLAGATWASSSLTRVPCVGPGAAGTGDVGRQTRWKCGYVSTWPPCAKLVTTSLTPVGSEADLILTWIQQAYRITSVAWKRSVGGMVRPSTRAVLRLMTSSNVMGCSTGRSAALVPLRILST
jgi:hypothetical protein